MTKEEALIFKSRWHLVNERTAEEIRRTNAITKLHQLAAMYAAGQSLGWSEGMSVGEDEVRERWQRLREKMNGSAQTF
ncbi:MAG: hypothetical protein ABI882_16540 [Acidobacteriota bacterium]